MDRGEQRLSSLIVAQSLVRAAATERDRYIHVHSTAGGRARRFSFANVGMHAIGTARQLAIAKRVEKELRARGVHASTLSIRVA